MKKKDKEDGFYEDAYRAAAKLKQKEGELEVDDNAVVSIGDDNGAYVQAWIWVSDEEAGLEEEEGEEDEES